MKYWKKKGRGKIEITVFVFSASHENKLDSSVRLEHVRLQWTQTCGLCSQSHLTLVEMLIGLWPCLVPAEPDVSMFNGVFCLFACLFF